MMNLVEKIIKGITEIEYEINPELLKGPDDEKKSTSHVMSYIQDYAMMGVLNIYSGPKVEFPGDPKKYDVAYDSNMFADLHERVQKSQLWWKWDEDERQFTLKPGFDTSAPGFWAIVLDLVDYYYDTYEERSKGTDDPQNIPGFNDDDDDDDEVDDGIKISTEPDISVYNKDVGGTQWNFSTGPGSSFNVTGRLSANELVIDAEASTVFLAWHNYDKVRYVFEWLAANTPPGAIIRVINVESKEVPLLRKLSSHGLIHSFSMRE